MATTGLGRLTIDMVMKSAAFEQGMDKAARKTRDTTRRMAKDAQDASAAMRAAFSSMATIVTGALAAISVGTVFTNLIANTKALEQEQAQLAAVLKSTGEAAGFSRDQLNSMGQVLADNSMFSTGEITKAQTTLLAFTGVIGNEFVRAQQAAADMAARTGMDISAAMETIGRSLDVPSKGLTALSRQGFRFTEEQAKLALYLESTGRTAEAQGIVLQALEESYGGAAKAARDTFGGAMTALQNTIANLTTGQEGSLEGARVAVESLNATLASPETTAAIGAMVDVAISGFELLVKAITAVPWEYTTHAVTVLAAVISARLVSSLAASAVAMGAGVIQNIRYQATLASMAGVSTAAAAGITAVGAAARVASGALALVGGPLGALLLAGAAAYAIFSDSSKATNEYGSSLQQLQTPIDQVTKSLQGMTKAQREATLEREKMSVSSAIDKEREAVVELQRFLNNDLKAAAKGSAGAINSLSLELQMAMGDTSKMLGVLEQAVAAGRVPESVLSSVRLLGGEVDDARQKIQTGRERVDEISSALANMDGQARAAASGVSALTEQFLNAQEAGAKYLADITKGNITAGIKTELGRLQALIKAGEIAFASPEQEQQAIAGAALRDKLTVSTKSLGDASKKAAAEMQSLLDRVLPGDKINRDYEEGQKLLNQAMASGKITADQYTLAMANLNMQRQQAVENLIPEETKRMQELERTFASGMQTFVIQQERALEGMGKGEQWNELANALGAVEDRYRGIAEQMAASTRGISDEDLEKLQEFKEAEMAIIEHYHNRRMELDGSYIEGAKRGMQEYIDTVGSASSQMQGVMMGALTTIENGLFDLVTTGKMDVGGMLQSIGQSVIRMMIQMGVQMAANFAMSKLFSTASAATSALTGAAIASAYAPAAAMASLASFGANAAPATAGIISTMGVAQMAAFAGMFDDGGRLPAGKWGIVGEFGPEIVKGPANITSREDTMRMLRNSQDGGNGDVIVQFYGNPDQVAAVEQDTNEFGQKVIRVLLNDWATGGEYASMLESSSNVQRIPR